MDSKKSNKIRQIVRLQQILKKWKKVASANNSNGSSKGTKLVKRSLSFTDNIIASSCNSNDDDDDDHHHHVVPKGSLAVCVGKELKRFVIPTEYLTHQAFVMLLREAEDEFGFQQDGVLKIPCSVSVFQKILKLVQEDTCTHKDKDKDKDEVDNCEVTVTLTVTATTTSHHHPQMCRIR